MRPQPVHQNKDLRTLRRIIAALLVWGPLLYGISGGGHSTAQEAVLAPSGPWLLYSAADGLFLANLDGSARTLLTLPPTENSRYQAHPAPTGSRFLLATQALPPITERATTPSADLRQFVLPGGGSRLILGSLLPDDLRVSAAAGGILAGLSAVGQPAWSPSGDRFAFVSGHEGTPDLYLYLESAGVSLRLTESFTYPERPTWSPNGRRLIWSERQTDGRTTAVLMATFASASGSTQDTSPQPLPLNLPSGRGWIFVGWQTPDRFVYSAAGPAGASGLFVYDCYSESVSILLPAETALLPPAYDPAGDTIVFVVPETGASPGPGVVPGLYRLHVASGIRTLIRPGAFTGVTLAASLEAFLVAGQDVTLLLPVDPARPTITLPAGDILPAPIGQALAVIRTDDGDEGPTLSVIPQPGARPDFAWNGEIAGPAWSPDGQSIYFVSRDPQRPGLMQIAAESGARTALDETATGDVLHVVAPRAVTVFADVAVPLCASAACAVTTATLAGDEAIAAVTGRNRAGDRLAIRLADGREGWVAAAALTTSLDVNTLTILAE